MVICVLIFRTFSLHDGAPTDFTGLFSLPPFPFFNNGDYPFIPFFKPKLTGRTSSFFFFPFGAVFSFLVFPFPFQV